MHSPNVLAALAALAALAFASGVRAEWEIATFQDKDCTVPTEGAGKTKVLSGTCDTNVKGGFSSMQVLHKWLSPAGTVSFYTLDACIGGHGLHEIEFFNPDIGKCHDFGFVANAIYLLG